jgi:ABC-type proline/glycine betaine transport system ATPase subunit
MREGRVVQRGSAADLLERPAEPFVRDFLRAQRATL